MDLDKLLTEQSNPASADLDQLSTIDTLRVINAADAEVAPAVAREIPRIAALVDAAAHALENGGRLFYTGAGTSGRLGVLDASECPPTFDVPPTLVQGLIAGGEQALRKAVEGAEDDPLAGARDLIAAGFNTNDVLVGISASGRTPYVLGALTQAREIGAKTGAISCSPHSEISAAADFPIEVCVGPEVLTGSTRMRAGTATKLVLNMISTGVMVRLGHVYGNLMVNVQPTNAKLVNRARRIIAAATGVTPERAAELLQQAGSVRIAIVMEKLHLDKHEAERALTAAKGRIRDARTGAKIG